MYLVYSDIISCLNVQISYTTPSARAIIIFDTQKMNTQSLKTQLKTPILMIVWTRPDLTRQVFEQIRKVRPRQLFIAGDAGRHPEEQAKCDKAREILKEVDWPCEVKTLFQVKNLGCKYGISTAVTWFFNNVEEGIILEDDCLPDESFFYYCQELLEKYRDDKRIMHISGDNFQQTNKNFACNGDYYFSRIAHEWGWATWRRAWNLYDISMSNWPLAKKSGLLYDIFKNGAVAYYWGHMFDDHSNKKMERKMDAWDGQWVFACLYNNGLCINPRTNLVSNIGFRADARRTSNPNDELANLPLQSVEIPLTHPDEIKVNEVADYYTHKYIYNINRYRIQQIKWFLKSRLTKPYLWLKGKYFKIKGSKIDEDKKLLIS